ncbi:MAG TPA: DUF3817 domain-containing protein [Acidimicrobiales bacterium]|nr:DUF3817 domain-containing protein [Acidimicrobiales bacterium]
MKFSFFALNIEGALARYRLMAFVVGIGLAVLVFVGMPLQYWASAPQLVHVVGPIHGIFYIVYLATAIDLVSRCRWNVIQLLPPVLAGLVPGVAFVVEHYTTKKVRNQFGPQLASSEQLPVPEVIGED